MITLDELTGLVALITLLGYSVSELQGHGIFMIQDRIASIIDEMANRIILQFHPEKIILFGSHARGTAGPDSDVMNVEGSKRQKATEIDLALFGLDLPVDVIVMRPEELDRNRNQIGTILYPALREGKVLYERAA